MLCDRCGEREATIHEVLIKQGQQRERHLCEKCANQTGVSAAPEQPIQDLVGKYMIAKNPARSAETQGRTCSRCQMAFSEFKQTGLLGCHDCYDSFVDRLGPLIERAHEGGTHHVGKLPKRALEQSRRRGGTGTEELVGGINERSARTKSIREQLAKAIEQEQYERAARLRDELEKLTGLSDDPHAGEQTEPLDDRGADLGGG